MNRIINHCLKNVNGPYSSNLYANQLLENYQFLCKIDFFFHSPETGNS